MNVADFHLKRLGEVPKLELTDVQAAWLAALIDGEGTIGVYREKRELNTLGFRYHPTVEIFNSNKALIDKIAEIVPGYIREKGPERVLKGHKRVYAFSIHGRYISQVLRKLESILIVKQKQAAAVILFLEVMDSQPIRGERPLQHILDKLYEFCKVQNQRGIPKPGVER